MIGERSDSDLNWLRRISSFTASRIVLTANNFRLFDHLDGKGKRASALARLLSADPRATALLLNSLTAIGLLKRDGALYRNSGVASRYLVKGRPDYQGDILKHYDVLWQNWSALDRVVKTGRPARIAHDHESFILGMHNIALQKVREVIRNMDLRKVKTILDLGGGPGTYAMALAERGHRVTLFDFPDTFRISRKLIRAAGLAKKIRLSPGDMMKESWGGPYDLVFISQIFHAYTEGECIALLRKCHECVKDAGKAVIHEFYLEETRTAPLHSALFAINMLVNTSGGRTYTVDEISSWMKKTGFSGISHKLLDETVLLEGTK